MAKNYARVNLFHLQNMRIDWRNYSVIRENIENHSLNPRE